MLKVILGYKAKQGPLLGKTHGGQVVLKSFTIASFKTKVIVVVKVLKVTLGYKAKAGTCIGKNTWGSSRSKIVY